MRSFPALTLLLVQKYSCLYNKKKITRWLEDMILFSRGEKQYFTRCALSTLDVEGSCRQD